jgi:hypothetical protein
MLLVCAIQCSLAYARKWNGLLLQFLRAVQCAKSRPALTSAIQLLPPAAGLSSCATAPPTFSRPLATPELPESRQRRRRQRRRIETDRVELRCLSPAVARKSLKHRYVTHTSPTSPCPPSLWAEAKTLARGSPLPPLATSVSAAAPSSKYCLTVGMRELHRAASPRPA